MTSQEKDYEGQQFNNHRKKIYTTWTTWLPAGARYVKPRSHHAEEN